MDPIAVGTVIGTSILSVIIFATCIYDNCFRKQTVIEIQDPLLVKKKSFKVKNLFGHIEI